uniref:PEGA domain-containing protein n=1 Tax=Thermus islandicus TaxID=540988 RepID=A0A7C2GFA1_9DEIN
MRTLLWMALALGAALAQKITPQGILINPVPTDLQVRVWVDKDPAKRGDAVYRIGEPIYIYVNVNQDAYVYLFNINADGKIDPILPNAYERNNLLRAGETRRFPPEGARYRYTITGPEGEDKILAVASRRPLSLGEILDVEANRVKVQGAEGLARALSIVIEPIPDRDWVTDVARYYVGRVATPPPVAAAVLVVDSRPSGAEVYLDGRLQGRTPLSLSVNPGRHEVELRLPGYRSYRVTVNPKPGDRVQIFAQLVAEVQEGTLVVDSSPSGAEVYVDGRLQGRTPLRMSLEAGRHEVRVAAPGYGEYRAQVEVRPGESVRLTVELVPVRATLELYVNAEARVFLDGQEVGVARGGYLRLEAPLGEHELTLVAPGYHTLVQTVRLSGNQVLRLTLSPL